MKLLQYPIWISILCVFCAMFIGVNVRGESVAFFFALDADLAALKDTSTADLRTIKVGSTSIQAFTVGKHRVFAAKMNVGNVETAIAVTVLLSRFPCDFAISIGPAGALVDSAKKHDWFWVKTVVGYQRGTFGSSGWQLSSDAKVSIPRDVFLSSEQNEEPPLFRKLTLASGDAFIAQPLERSTIRETAEAEIVDMNTFGLASACMSMKTPLVVWRVVSDSADENANADFRSFVGQYDGKGGKMLRARLLEMSPSPASVESYENIRKALGMP